MHYHIVHIIPDPRMHGLNGYFEVTETFRWGLESLGHKVTGARNARMDDAVNIIFGFQLLSREDIAAFPRNTIIYNLEQIAKVPADKIWHQYHYAAQHFQVWDYSRTNLNAWRTLHANCKPKLVPIGYAPLLTRIPKRSEEIDVLFYGLPNQLRLSIFQDICRIGLRAVFLCGLYGTPRDEIISQAKIVLNLNLYTGRIFEIVRVSYPLANSKAVVSDLYPDTDIEDDLRQAIAFAPVDQIVDKCVNLANDPAARQALEQRGLEAMRRRDIRAILQSALYQ